MLRQTFALNNYAMYIQDDVLDRGRKLLEGEGVRILEQRDDLYVFQVLDQSESFEVEILYARRKVRNYSCDCLEDTSGFCCHIAAALTLLDQRIQKETKQLRRKPKPSLRSLSTRSLMNRITEKELRQFVLQHAQLDERLALALKTRFAHKVDLLEEYNHEKYYQLLRNFWKLTASKRSVTAFKKLDRHLRELLALSEDLLAKEDIREVYALLFGIQKFLMVGQLGQHSEVLQSCEIELCQQFVNLLGSDYSPKLKDRHFKDLIELIDEGSYTPPDPALNLYLALFQFGDKQVKKHIEARLVATISLSNEYALQSLIAIFIQQNEVAIKLDIFKRFYGKLRFFELFFDTIEGRYSEEDFFDLSTQLYRTAKGMGTREFIFKEVKQTLTDRKYVLEWMLAHFESTLQFDLLPEIKELSGVQWGTHRMHAEEKYLKADNFSALVNLYALDEENDKLLLLLATLSNLDRQLECAARIPAKHAKEVFSILRDGFSVYLKVHVGYPSALAVAQHLRTMELSWLRRLVPELIQYIRSEFGDRRLLVRSLAGELI